jgi:SpoVK/Ycf46/Vps4 family AAA+-type ATPase
MGVCLAGPPGTGKSSLARGVAQQFGLPLYAVELATMTDRDLIRAWQRARNDAPAVVLIEDVDTVFEGRKPPSWPRRPRRPAGRTPARPPARRCRS